ncbi:MAG: Oligopeptide transport system permease protein OppC [Chloroflexi bacterium ADurb.Bin325]|nr:MAG: Oligopeptide transport system permease protein OppC [Chloroflexi bacterium ADurb.Bin325]
MTDTALTTNMPRRKPSAEERYYMASQWELMRRKFRKHRLANVSLVVLALLYLGAIFCGFIAPYSVDKRDSDYLFAPPQRITFRDPEGNLGWRPYVFGFNRERNPKTLKLELTVDETKMFPVYFFMKGEPYSLLGFKSDIHLFGVEKPGYFYLMGTDKLGRDIFSRIWYGARVSLTIGLIGVTLSFILGCLIGGISGYYGGTIDMLVQRIIEFLISIPTIPLWMALAAAIPRNWPQYQVYFAITIILSLVGWCGLARVVRGKLISLREEDYVLAARLSGQKDMNIIVGHLLPAFMSYLIVNLTLAVPGMILGETALSFLGLGLRAPAVSWGVLLYEAQQVAVVMLYPWLLWPGAFVIITVLAFNFLGDGLRDAADPYR